MNKVILVGRLARDPELRTTNTGKSVATFSLAVDRRFKQEGKPKADSILLHGEDRLKSFASILARADKSL